MHSGLSGVLIMPVSQTIFILLLSIFISRSLVDDENLMKNKINKINKIYSVSQLTFCISVLLILALHLSLLLLNSMFYDNNCVVNTGPRLWVDGGILPCEVVN